MKNTALRILLLTAFMAACGTVAAQDTTGEDTAAENSQIVLPPLFQYPVAPEEMDWNERSSWLVEHFWDPFDFKQQAVGQHQLNHAFYTWTVPMHYSSSEVTYKAVEALMKKLEKNPTLLLQFTRAAEYNIYDPETAQVWVDDLYLPFLKAVAKNKKVSAALRTRYAMQEKTLDNTRLGRPLPAFAYTDRTGAKRTFCAEGVATIVEFGNPSCSDCQMARIALKGDDYIRELTQSGQLKIFFIIPDVDPDDTSWMMDVMDYPDSWTVGAAEGLDDIIDLRLSPGLFLIDPSGNIRLKNTGLDQLRRELRTMMSDMVPKDSQAAPDTETDGEKVK